ncbi:unnamed protein product, partial [Owenia fusiformis]
TPTDHKVQRSQPLHQQIIGYKEINHHIINKERKQYLQPMTIYQSYIPKGYNFSFRKYNLVHSGFALRVSHKNLAPVDNLLVINMCVKILSWITSLSDMLPW